MKIMKAILESAIVVTFFGWLYVIFYQSFYPIGITDGHPLAHCFPLNLIRVDIFGIWCFAIFGVALFLFFWKYKK